MLTQRLCPAQFGTEQVIVEIREDGLIRDLKEEREIRVGDESLLGPSNDLNAAALLGHPVNRGRREVLFDPSSRTRTMLKEFFPCLAAGHCHVRVKDHAVATQADRATRMYGSPRRSRDGVLRHLSSVDPGVSECLRRSWRCCWSRDRRPWSSAARRDGPEGFAAWYVGQGCGEASTGWHRGIQVIRMRAEANGG